MWNIMKALRYQIKRDNFTIEVLIFAVIIPFLSLLIDSSGVEFGEMTGSMYVSGFVGENYLLVIIAALLFSTRIAGWDYNDKTINYEILSGHSKKETYFARAILSVIWSGIAYIIVMVIPMLVFTLINGWGNSLSLKNAVMRCLLMIFPIFRIACLFVLLTFLMTNYYKVLVTGFTLFGAANVMIMVMEELLDKKFTVQLASSNMAELMSFPDYKQEYINGKNVIVFDSAIKNPLACNTIIVSIIVGAVALILGYTYFKNHDMN